ncbi:RNA polymerase sigma factor [Micromonospora sp. WMMD730]|uniref:RNA polymerase sigma factor n=1 Tax=Micromonospora sp. WMMD730 TaxID=3404128 RepID=UPI003B92607D
MDVDPVGSAGPHHGAGPAGQVGGDPVGAVAVAGAEAYPRIVAALIRVTGDWTLAEDCAQEALAAAVQRWPRDGVPGNPGGWLMTVARNRATDVLRRATVERRKLRELALLTDPQPTPDDLEEDVVDDRLRLVFTCCHPALSLEARVALTLRTVAGVPTADIARAFLVGEATMTRRITRAKARIAAAGVPYRVPTGPALAERLPGVLAVLYLLFTRGYDADGEPAFADEAVRLARLLDELMPAEPEVAALCALLLFQHSRRAARRDAAGDLLTLAEQDRSRWDHAAIAEARAALARAERRSAPARADRTSTTAQAGSPPATAQADGPSDTARTDRPGPYLLQARIAACHATVPDADRTDWPTIAHWYDELSRLRPTPVIGLNRAVAHGYAYGPTAGLALLAGVRAGGALDGYPPALAVEAELTARRGDPVRAALLFRAAADLVGSAAERRALLRRADDLAPPR